MVTGCASPACVGQSIDFGLLVVSGVVSRLVAPQEPAGRTYRRGLGGVLLLAFVLRTVYALRWAPKLSFLDDDNFFYYAGKELAQGQGYVTPLAAFFGKPSLPTAAHPALYPLLLAVLSKGGLVSVNAERLLNLVIGTGTVLLVALLARRTVGRRAALIAAGLCAVYPAFIASDGAIMSETLFTALVAGALLQALRLLEQPSNRGVAGLGILIALATLTRSEGLLLLPLLVMLVVRSPGVRLPAVITAAVSCALVLAPWVIRNWVELGHPVLSDNQGITVAGANCNSTYYGDQIAGFDAACISPPGTPSSPRDQSEATTSSQAQARGVRYAENHAARAILVAAARLAAVWGLYAPGRQAVVPGRSVGLQKAGVAMYYLLLAFAVIGAAALWRQRRRPVLLVLLAPCIVASVTAILTHGLVRLRQEAEPSLIVLTAATATAALAALQDTSPGSPTSGLAPTVSR